MEDCIRELVIKRCEQVTITSKELKLLDDCESEENAARALAEELCYKQGFKDALEFMKKLNMR
ncbi:hypothetical protein [Anaerosporobacter sp.]